MPNADAHSIMSTTQMPNLSTVQILIKLDAGVKFVLSNLIAIIGY